MSSPILLAYSGSLEACAAISWLRETRAADVVTLTLDVGQDQPVEQLRVRALACGARRAHVIDVRDEFARDCVVPSIDVQAVSPGSIGLLARPLIARKLLEVAAIEGASVVAHTSLDERFHAAVSALDPSIRVVAPAREWPMDADQLGAYTRTHTGSFVPPAAGVGADHLLVRCAADPATAPDGEARLELTFSDRIPVALNGVPMSVAELVESLSLIAGQYGIGWRETIPAPAALVLRAAYAALREPAGMVTLKVSRGEHVVLASDSLVSAS